MTMKPSEKYKLILIAMIMGFVIMVMCLILVESYSRDSTRLLTPAEMEQLRGDK